MPLCLVFNRGYHLVYVANGVLVIDMTSCQMAFEVHTYLICKP
jgi:hypothetical protein